MQLLNGVPPREVEKGTIAFNTYGKNTEEAPTKGKNSGAKFNFPSISNLFTKANGFIGRGSSGGTIGDDDLAGPAVKIGQLLMGIATVVLFIVTIVMAIKYMVAEPQEQAKLKTQLVGLAISAAVIFGAFTIWQVSVKIMTSVTSG